MEKVCQPGCVRSELEQMVREANEGDSSAGFMEGRLPFHLP